MPAIRLTLDLNAHPWLELNALREQGKVITALGAEARDILMGAMANSTEGGDVTLAIGIELPDGTIVIGETTLAALAFSVRTLEVVHKLKKAEDPDGAD